MSEVLQSLPGVVQSQVLKGVVQFIVNHCPHWFTLNVSQNQLTALPDAVGNLAQLNQLNPGNNQLRLLPESLKKLTNVRVLMLAHNSLLQLNPPHNQIGCQLTPINLDAVLRPTLRGLAVARIVRNNIPYNTQDIPRDCINAIQNPKTYRVMLFTTQLGELTLDEAVPIIMNLSYQEIRGLVYNGTAVILMN